MSDEANRPDEPPAASPGTPTSEEVPLGQRLFDRPILLLVACIVVMFLFFTGWGWVELATLPDAPLP